MVDGWKQKIKIYHRFYEDIQLLQMQLRAHNYKLEHLPPSANIKWYNALNSRNH